MRISLGKLNGISKRKLAVVGSALTLGASSLAAVALADQLSIDGDIGTTATDNPLSVTAAPGATVSTTAGLKIDWSGGSGKHVVAGTTVNFSVNALQTTLPAGYSVGSTSVAIPTGTGWDGSSDSTGTGNSAISFTAPNTPGPYSYDVKWSSDESCTSSPCLNNPALKINLTVTAPPANHAPTVSTDAGNVSGNEGSPGLSNSGAFSDQDNDALTLSLSATDVGSLTGSLTPSGGGPWSWSYVPSDNGSGTVTVTADDGKPGGTVADSFNWTALNVPPTIDGLSVTGSDCDGSADFTVNDAGSADTESGTVDWGDSTTADTFSGVAAGGTVSKSHTFTAAGPFTVTVNASDDDGGPATASTQSYTPDNIPSTILQPINYTGPRSAFKLGGTIPVKIQVTDCGGNYVSTLAPTVKLQKVDVNNDPDGTDIEPVSTANPTSGTTMRYDSTAQQYIYNLATKGLALANYMVFVSDPSFASPVTVVITLKK